MNIILTISIALNIYLIIYAVKVHIIKIELLKTIDEIRNSLKSIMKTK